MKAINVTELKAHLSKYLRMAARGSLIIVKDRDEPIAAWPAAGGGVVRGASASHEKAGFDWGRKNGASSRSPGSIDASTSKRRSVPYARTRVKYVDASAVLRILFSGPGSRVPLADGRPIVSSQLIEVETFRAVDRERLLGNLDDDQTASKRKELGDLLAMLDLAPIDGAVIGHAKRPFAVNVRALDAIHVATAEVLTAEADGEPVEFWTHDDRQATAALSRGLTVRGMP